MSDRLSGMTSNYWRGIGPGKTVWFRTPQGQERSGRVTMSFATHLVLNCGGRHGTPAVVDEKNFIEKPNAKDHKRSGRANATTDARRDV